MKVCVITPYYEESDAIISRCMGSVRKQTYPNWIHMLVSDGYHVDERTLGKIEHMILPRSHKDAGATPRALGAISAFSRGFDAVAFLDVDNTFSEGHLEQMVAICKRSDADVVAARRNICSLTGEVLYTDTFESNGNDFCDTNCMFLTRNTLPLMTNWITQKDIMLFGDRYFWNKLKENKVKIEINAIPTVNYYSKWAVHYQNSGKIPPDDSVWISQDSEGKLVHRRHGDNK